MNNSVSVVYYVDKLSNFNPFFFGQIGYKKVLQEQEFVIQEPVEKYINTICGIEVEIIIGVKTSIFANNDNKWIYEIADKVFTIGDNVLNADAYNMLFRNCSNDFVCLLKSHFFTEANWLQELIFFQKNIQKSGVVGISSSFLSCEFTPMLSANQENMIGVFLPKNEAMEVAGAYLFDKQLLYFVGAFDNNPAIDNYEFLQWQMRCTRMGFHNFYIPTQSCIQISVEKIYDTDKLIEVNNSVEEMRKNRNFYIPLDTF